MKSIEDEMSFYAAYHQDARNKATHFIGVPAIMLSLFIPLAWIRIEVGGVTLTAAMLFAAVVMAYYFILDVPLGVSVELGRVRMPVRQLLALTAGSVIELAKLAGEPLDVLINGRPVARGEAVMVNEKFGVRLTEIVSQSERVERLK